MVRNLIKKTIPPLLVQACRGLVAKSLGHGLYTGPYRSWERAVKQASGYDSAVILKHVLESSQKAYLSPNRAFERDGVLIETPEYGYPLMAYLAKKALISGGKLNIIDFGGGLGSSYHQCKQFFGDSIQFNWQIVEQPNFVACGQQLQFTPELSFHHQLEDCKRHDNDILLVSGVLQYLEDPLAHLANWSKQSFDKICIDRLPLTNKNHHQIMIQHVPKSLYKASYPSWLFARNKFESKLSELYSILDSFDAIDGKVSTLKRDISFEGYWLKSK